jgi:hypothetical protein
MADRPRGPTPNEQEPYPRFADEATWKEEKPGLLKREPIDPVRDATFRIRRYGEQFHTIPEWSFGLSHGGHTYPAGGPFDRLEEAKRNLYDRYCEMCKQKSDFMDRQPRATSGLRGP